MIEQSKLTKQILVEEFEKGCKPKSAWKIGTEHEKFLYDLETLKPIAYEGERGIEAFLARFAQKFDWHMVKEHERVIALSKGSASITLEPGGQVELSGAPLSNLHDTCAEMKEHISQVKEIAQLMNLGVLGAGFLPLWAREDMNWMPKGRYKIMQRYMPLQGSLGLDMMTRTTTVQTNIDFSSEQDMVKKLRVSMALQPLVTALFSSSPIVEGQLTSYQSYRHYVWQNTDPDRTGYIPHLFDGGFGFESYVDYALSVPMYFVYRDGIYHDVAGASFVDFMQGRLKGFEGEFATLEDWHQHLTTLFPEVRMKSYLEMRGADVVSTFNLCALPAFWVGVLYDEISLNACYEIISQIPLEAHLDLYYKICKEGLEAQWDQKPLKYLAQEILNLSYEGLLRRQIACKDQKDEASFLAPLFEILKTGKTQASSMREFYTQNDVHDSAFWQKFYQEFSY